MGQLGLCVLQKNFVAQFTTLFHHARLHSLKSVFDLVLAQT
jgi:hypothetical protein